MREGRGFRRRAVFVSWLLATLVMVRLVGLSRTGPTGFDAAASVALVARFLWLGREDLSGK